MNDRRHFRVRRPRAALLWGLALFLAGQGAFALALVLWRPYLCDPEFSFRRDRLDQRLQQRQPEQPFVLVLGSSRVAMGLRPEAIAGKPGAPLVFNFSMLGSGPVMELICLRRLLADGVRPDLVMVEVWAPFLHQEGRLREVDRFEIDRLARGDMELMARYSADPGHLYRRWLETQATPWFSHRLKLVSQFLPAWLPHNLRRDHKWRELDEWGWLPNRTTPDDPKTYQKRFQQVREYFNPVFQKYRIGQNSRKAMRELLDLCRDEHIPAALFYMPEGPDFRGLYTADAIQQVETLVGNLHKEYGVPVFDTRDWMAPEKFLDGFHLLTDGAWQFTERFEREVIRPVVAASRAP